MFRNIFLILISVAALFSAACQSVEKPGANAGNSGAATANAQANLPPEFSGKTSNESATGNSTADPNAPKATVLPKGATPTPGIPSEEEIKKQQTASPKKTPLIPGFPSEAEMKRQMNTSLNNQRIREAKPPIAESNSSQSSPTERPRKARKP